MPHQVTMPMLGLTMEEGTITEWLKKEGDTVDKEEPLFVVESDKSAVEVGALPGGVLQQILVPTGQAVAVSTPIAVIAQPGEATAATASAAPSTAPERATDSHAADSRPAGRNGRGGRRRVPAPAAAAGGRAKVSPVRGWSPASWGSTRAACAAAGRKGESSRATFGRGSALARPPARPRQRRPPRGG